jgi:hypothetical protein
MFAKIRAYFINRFIDRTHILGSRLPRGVYHEFDERVLYCLFDSLQHFVEGELAWFHAILNEDKFKIPKFRLSPYKNREAGLAHLAWESGLLDDDGSPSRQALAAREVERLYRWWVDERPKRIDPYYDRSGSVERIYALEKSYEAEDTEMLIALVRLRGCLWT